jgi:hypothetical protein
MRGGALNKVTHRSLRNSHPIAAKGRQNCHIRRRLLNEYDRAFDSWVTHAAEAGDLTTAIEATEWQRSCVALVEEKHRELLEHEQCCRVCNESVHGYR